MTFATKAAAKFYYKKYMKPFLPKYNPSNGEKIKWEMKIDRSVGSYDPYTGMPIGIQYRVYAVINRWSKVKSKYIEEGRLTTKCFDPKIGSDWSGEKYISIIIKIIDDRINANQKIEDAKVYTEIYNALTENKGVSTNG